LTHINFEIVGNDKDRLDRLCNLAKQERLLEKCLWKEGFVNNGTHFYWIVKKDNLDVGYITITPVLPKICTIHIAGLRVIYGQAYEIGLQFFNNELDEFKKPFNLLAHIPQRNILAVRLAKRLGFKVIEVMDNFLELDTGEYQRLHVLSKVIN
jgi:hypothetical protein